MRRMAMVRRWKACLEIEHDYEYDGVKGGGRCVYIQIGMCGFSEKAWRESYALYTSSAVLPSNLMQVKIHTSIANPLLSRGTTSLIQSDWQSVILLLEHI